MLDLAVLRKKEITNPLFMYIHVLIHPIGM